MVRPSTLVRRRGRSTLRPLRIATGSIPDGIRRAVAWLEASPPARRELVIAPPFPIGSITAADIAAVPASIGLRFERAGALPAARTVDAGRVLATNGVFDRDATLDGVRTLVRDTAAAERAVWPIEIINAPDAQPAIDAAVAAVLSQRVWAPAADRRARVEADIEAAGAAGSSIDFTVSIGGLEVGRLSHQGPAVSESGAAQRPVEGPALKRPLVVQRERRVEREQRWHASVDVVPVGDPPWILRAAVAPSNNQAGGASVAHAVVALRREPLAVLFDRFWRGAVAALALAAPPPIEVVVSPPILRPLEHADVSVRLRSGAGAAVAASVDGESIRLWPEPETGAYRGTFTARATPGRMSIDIDVGGDRPHNATSEVVVEEGLQARTGAPVPLSLLASSHRGIDVTPDRIDELLLFVRASVIASDAVVVRRPLRSTWWLLAFAASLSGEWWLRRRRGHR